MSMSPMMTHYLQKKAEYPDCIIFYRLGDFYEMFFEDAVTVSDALGLTLTGRDCGIDKKAPMCGIPYHAADTYIAKLLKLNFKVAICEQLTEPEKGKMVERDVIKVITPGTVFEPTFLEENNNNFIASIYLDKKADTCSVSWCDVSTGEFFSALISSNLELNLSDLLLKISPSEIITDENFDYLNKNLSAIKLGYCPKIEFAGNIKESIADRKATILAQFKNAENDINKLQSAATNAIYLLLKYLLHTQKTVLSNIVKISMVNYDNFVKMDSNTRKNLELLQNTHDGKKNNTLYSVLNYTKTGMGSRLLSNFISSPLTNKAEIENRLNGVEELTINSTMLSELMARLKKINDIERLCGKLAGGNFMPKDAYSLKETLDILPELNNILKFCKSNILVNAQLNILDFSDMSKLINDSIEEDSPSNLKNGGYIKPTFNKELLYYKDINENSKSILAQMEQEERERTGIKNLRIAYTSVFGYYIEVTNSQSHLVPINYIRKQTTTNAERYITEDLKNLETKILSANETILKLESTIFAGIKENLKLKIEALQKTAASIAEVDVLCSLAYSAINNNYVKPKICENGQLLIEDGRHPIIEQLNKGQFVPNDTNLDTDKNKTMLITGPNMAGKSTYMRQVALINIMAQIGSFVPCKSATVSIIDSLFTRIGASDDLAFGHSTFMVEMIEVSNILERATGKSLIILDEVGRGTSTYDGLSIAYSIMKYISETLCAKTLFATHYHELITLEGKFEGLKNYSIATKEFNGSVLFLHKIIRGGANKSYGIEVAKLAGLPNIVIDNAKEFLSTLELGKSELATNSNQDTTIKQDCPYSNEVVNIIKDIDINKLTPFMALDLINNLKSKLENNNE